MEHVQEPLGAVPQPTLNVRLEEIRGAVEGKVADVVSIRYNMHVGVYDEFPEAAEYANGTLQYCTPDELDQAGRLTMALVGLKANFEAQPNLHQDLDWNRVKDALLANLEALESVGKMMKAGHEPNVYNFDDSGFDIGTCSKESPLSGRNCVYDAKAAAWRRATHPRFPVNGSAVEMAAAMGMSLMSLLQYQGALQSQGVFDRTTQSYLLTNEAYRHGGALYGGRGGDGVHVYLNDPCYHCHIRAFRGSLRVLWAESLSHSIL